MSRDDVLAAWSGLRYYARARRLFDHTVASFRRQTLTDVLSVDVVDRELLDALENELDHRVGGFGVS